MKKIEFTVYTYDELSEDAKKVALKNVVETLEFDDWDIGNLTEWFAEQLREKGLPDDDIRWSLSNCQGDGVAFYGRIDLEKFEKAHPSIGPELRYLEDFGAWVEIEKRQAFHHYDHYNTMVISAYFDDGFWSGLDDRVINLINERLDTVVEYIQDHVKEVSKELESNGYAEIEYKTGEDFALESGVDLHNYLEDGTIHERCVH